MNFKIGDRVLIEKDYLRNGEYSGIFNGKKGQVVYGLTTGGYCIHIKLDSGVVIATHIKGLKKLEATMDNLEVGTILVDKSGSERKVLGICGEVVFCSLYNDFDIAETYYTAKELKKDGYKVKDQNEVKEMTVKEVSELVGQEVKIVEDK